jgi:hypothetical protein
MRMVVAQRIISFILGMAGLGVLVLGGIYVWQHGIKVIWRGSFVEGLKGLGITIGLVAVAFLLIMGGDYIDQRLKKHWKQISDRDMSFISFFEKNKYANVPERDTTEQVKNTILEEYKVDKELHVSIGKSAVITRVQRCNPRGMEYVYQVSDQYDEYIPIEFRANHVDELQSYILIIETKGEVVGRYTNMLEAFRTSKYFFVIDKNTEHILATKLFTYEPATELISREDHVERRYDKKTKEWNDSIKMKEKTFLQSLYRK